RRKDQPRPITGGLTFKAITAPNGANIAGDLTALGARVLVKGVGVLGFGPEHGARYLSVQGGSLDSWRTLLVALEGLDRQAWDVAAQAARAVFVHAIQAFTSEELSPA
ncbi:heme oxygenase, partial [Bosea sp. BE271]|nr:heme oxygenase [Bosea robiniae]MDR6893904.1 heme oxygenase [Bosea sp. BE109]MDR7136396.1 heme oxygenase [Bosea sp. BE168]MDR7173095.1 heme oxygenase [Bosea sp. BE271]